MGWGISENGFQTVLSPCLPQLIVDHLGMSWTPSWRTITSPARTTLDPGDGRPNNPSRNRNGDRVVKRGTGCFVGVSAQSWQSFLSLSAPGAGGSFQTATSGYRNVFLTGCHGTGVLFGISPSQVELMGSEVLKTDVFILGGGPAGLAAGIALRQRGLNVVVADLAQPPIDKVCGEGLMPQTVAGLKGLGVTLGPSQAIPFRGIRFIGDGRVAEGAFAQGYGLGIRRTTLHHALVERAAEAGVQTLWGSRVKGFGGGVFSIDTGKVLCRWIIGAHGQNSLVR